MKETVIVNGVVLTREQVEGAMKELNAPKPFKGGERFSFYGAQFMVLDQRGHEVCVKGGNPKAEGKVCFVCLQSGRLVWATPEFVRRYFKLVV